MKKRSGDEQIDLERRLRPLLRVGFETRGYPDCAFVLSRPHDIRNVLHPSVEEAPAKLWNHETGS